MGAQFVPTWRCGIKPGTRTYHPNAPTSEQFEGITTSGTQAFPFRGLTNGHRFTTHTNRADITLFKPILIIAEYILATTLFFGICHGYR